MVSGTGSGQGRAAALRFAHEGAVVIGCDLREEAAETVEVVRAAGGTMVSMQPVDLSVESEVAAWIEFARTSFGGFDVLYNNAASMRQGTIETLERADWEFTFANEVLSIVAAVRFAVPVFRDRGGGCVINVASVAGSVGAGLPGNGPGLIAHCVGKAAVIRLSECLAIELAPLNVRVNTISPGPIATRALRYALDEGADPRFRRWFSECGLVGRLGEPDEVVAAAVFLASEEASFITGINLPVDGGFTVSGGGGRADQEVAKAVGFGGQD